MTEAPSRTLGALARTVTRRVFPADPGGIRLHDAAAATLSGVATFLATLIIARFVPLPGGIEVFGFAASVFVAVSVHDDTLEAQRITTVLAFLPMALLLLATSLLVAYPTVLDALLVVLIACALYAPVLGPRYAALATIAVTSELFGVVTRPPWSEIEERLAILVLAVAGAFLVRFWFLKLGPSDIARRVAAGIAQGIAAMLVPVSEAVRTGAFSPDLRRQASEAVDRLEEAMTVAQAKLGPNPATRPLANHLLDLEFASERVVRAALHALPAPGPDRDAALASLAVIRVGLVSGMPPRLAETTPPNDHVVAQLAFLASIVGKRAVEAFAPPPSLPLAIDAKTRRALLAQSIQAAVAVAVAIAAGHVLSSTRWYWAAFTTFLVFQGVRSRQETALKAWQIAIGTVGGAFAGVLVATALSGHVYAATAISIAALFLAFYASSAAYGVMIFWVTVIIGLVFGMLGFFPPALLAIRLEETLLGVACGVGAAFLIRLDAAPDSLDAARRTFLDALRTTISAAAPCLTGEGDTMALQAASAAMQRDFIAYGSLALPRLRGLTTMWNQGTRRALTRFRACSHWAQDLAYLAAGNPHETDPATIAALEAEARSIAALIDDDRATSSSAQARAVDAGRLRFAPAGASPTSHEAFRLMLAIESALRRVTDSHPNRADPGTLESAGAN